MLSIITKLTIYCNRLTDAGMDKISMIALAATVGEAGLFQIFNKCTNLS